jgi:hypothetical protein
MISNEAQSLKISPTFSPQSPHENVKIGGQESKQEQRLLNDQSEDVAGIWTKVPGNRTTRLNNRKKVLNQFEDKFITPSPPVTVKCAFISLRLPLYEKAPPNTKQLPILGLLKKRRANKNLLPSKLK